MSRKVQRIVNFCTAPLIFAVFLLSSPTLSINAAIHSADRSISILPLAGWRTTGGVVLKENGRIYVTDGKAGFAGRNCPVNLSEYPYLMVRMNDSLPGGLWSIFMQRDNQKLVLPPTAIWEKPGLLAANWRSTLYPLLARAIQDRIIPVRETVRSLVRYAIAWDHQPPWERDYGEGLREFYARVYKPRSLFDVFPKTNNYFVPLFLEPTLKAGSQELSSGYKMRKDPGHTVFVNMEHQRNGTSGNAFMVKNGSTYFVMNGEENRSSNQHYQIKLAGNFALLQGSLRTNEYLLARQIDSSDVEILLNLRPRAAASSFQVKFPPHIVEQPRVSLIAGSNEVRTGWDGKHRELLVDLGTVAQGSVEILVSSE